MIIRQRDAVRGPDPGYQKQGGGDDGRMDNRVSNPEINEIFHKTNLIDKLQFHAVRV
tara:strand:- start:465 stop:635 length:171 start_codon:yes stop_codon:yes gene_type:complete